MKRNIVKTVKIWVLVLLCMIGLFNFSVPTYAAETYNYNFSFDNTEGIRYWGDTWQVYITVAPGTVVTVSVQDTHTVLDKTLFIWQNDDGLLINPDVDFGKNSYTFPEIKEGENLVAQCPVWEHYADPNKAPKEVGYVNFYVSTYSSKVSAEKLQEIATLGGDYDIVMEDYVWHVNPQGVDVGTNPLDMTVEIDSGVIEESVVNTYFYGYDTMELSLAHDGAFPFSKTVLELDAGVERAGKYGALYYYENNGFTYITSALVSEDGKLNFDFQHASDYIVTFSDKEGDVEFVDVASKPSDESNEDNEVITDGAISNDNESQSSEWIVPIIVAGIVIIVVVMLVLVRKKK